MVLLGLAAALLVPAAAHGAEPASAPSGSAPRTVTVVDAASRAGLLSSGSRGTAPRGVSLTVTDDAPGGIVRPGSLLTYRVTVTNNAESSRRLRTLTVRLADGLSLQGTDNPDWNLQGTTARLSRPIEIPARGGVVIPLGAVVDSDAAGVLRTVVATSGRSTDDCLVNPVLSGCGTELAPAVVDPTHPTLSVVAMASGQDVDRSGNLGRGDTLDFRVEVRNTGTAPATDLSVQIPFLDAAGLTVSCDRASLAPGARTVCRASAPYVITAEDVQLGQVRAVAVARAGSAVSRPAAKDVTVYSDVAARSTSFALPGPNAVNAGLIAVILTAGMVVTPALVGRRRAHPPERAEPTE